MRRSEESIRGQSADAEIASSGHVNAAVPTPHAGKPLAPHTLTIHAATRQWLERSGMRIGSARHNSIDADHRAGSRREESGRAVSGIVRRRAPYGTAALTCPLDACALPGPHLTG